jgi:chromosome segregation ATPase
VPIPTHRADIASSAIPSPARTDARRDASGLAKSAARGADGEPVQDELTRLASLVDALLLRFAALRDENAALVAELDARSDHVAALEAEVQRLQEARKDVAVRIDELIGQIDELEGRLVAQAEIP